MRSDATTIVYLEGVVGDVDEGCGPCGTDARDGDALHAANFRVVAGRPKVGIDKVFADAKRRKLERADRVRFGRGWCRADGNVDADRCGDQTKEQEHHQEEQPPGLRNSQDR